MNALARFQAVESPLQQMAAQLAQTVMEGRPLLLQVNGVPAAVVFLQSEASGLEEAHPVTLDEDWDGEHLLWALGLLEEDYSTIDYSQLTAALVNGALLTEFYGRRVVYRVHGGVGDRSTISPVKAEKK